MPEISNDRKSLPVPPQGRVDFRTFFPPLLLLPLLLLLLFLCLTMLVGCGSGDSSPREEDPAPPVEAVVSRTGALPLEERLSGLVRAHNQVEVRPQITATVTEVLVRSGQAVDQGQVLVRLDAAALNQQVRKAEAGLKLAQAGLKEEQARVAELNARLTRTRALAEQNLVSRLDLETLEAQFSAAEAAVEVADARVDETAATVAEIREQASKTEVRSPVAGRIGRSRVEVGLLVSPGTLLFQVGSLDRVIVEIPLTESMLDDLRPGQTALLSPDDSKDPVRATLTRISPFLEGESFSTVGEIDVENTDGRFHPGMFVTVDVLYGETEQATLVPGSALWDDPQTGTLGIFVLDTTDGEPAAELGERTFGVELRQVRVLAEGRSTIGVTGIEEGEWVVTVGQNLLAADDRGTARARAGSWERIERLQALQREDLLNGFLDKQRRLAEQLGADLPAIGEMTDAAPAERRGGAG